MRRKRLDDYGTIHYVGPFQRNVGNGCETTTKTYSALGRLTAFRKDGVLHWVGTDHLGSTIKVADASFGSVDQQRYRPFGASRLISVGGVKSEGDNLGVDHRYTGQIDDASIGLYWYNSRAYDPTIGRFVQADTIVPEPGNPQALNRYAYVHNNPLRYSDPTGHAPYVIFVGGRGTAEDGQWRMYLGAMDIAEGDHSRYGYYDWEGRSGTVDVSHEAAVLRAAILDSGSDEVYVIGHSKGGALVAELLAQIAEGSDPLPMLRGAAILEAPIAGNVWSEGWPDGEHWVGFDRFEYEWSILNGLMRVGYRDRLANLEDRLRAQGMSTEVVIATHPGELTEVSTNPSVWLPELAGGDDVTGVTIVPVAYGQQHGSALWTNILPVLDGIGWAWSKWLAN